jgi:hypothetical protein
VAGIILYPQEAGQSQRCKSSDKITRRQGNRPPPWLCGPDVDQAR